VFLSRKITQKLVKILKFLRSMLTLLVENAVINREQIFSL
jgi:hypothetical protein